MGIARGSTMYIKDNEHTTTRRDKACALLTRCLTEVKLGDVSTNIASVAQPHGPERMPSLVDWSINVGNVDLGRVNQVANTIGEQMLCKTFRYHVISGTSINQNHTRTRKSRPNNDRDVIVTPGGLRLH